MTNPARLAFAYARTRALRGRLLGPEDADRLRSAAGAPAHSAALAALGVEARGPLEARAAMLQRFASDADKLLRAWPIGRGLLSALVGLLEIENLKLGFRARGAEFARWQRYWLELGRVAQLPRSAFLEALTLRAAVLALVKTPYGPIASQVFRAHEGDPPAAQLALDRFASQRLVVEARRVPADEDGARELALSLVRERDLEALLRPAFAYGPEAAAGATVLLREELRPEALLALAAWKPGLGPLQPLLPRRLARLVPAAVADLPALRLALRKARREACLRAFLGRPFQLASAVSLLVLRLEELGALTALAESRFGEAEPLPSEALQRALGASAMGA